MVAKINIPELSEQILAGNVQALAKGITLVESHNPVHRALANELINILLPHSGHSLRMGVTGVPGVGKSTFIESLGVQLIERHQGKVAVLAIDPSSTLSGGSILGDKTRMRELSHKKEAFIRPTPSKGFLGGVANHTRESILLCEAAGFNYIIVETVGVGQSETAVESMVDVFLLLMLPGAGDELQGIKRGIMEMADILLINKAEGEWIPKAKDAAQNYKLALHLFPAKHNLWTTKVLLISALQKTGINEVIQELFNFREQTTQNGSFERKRNTQRLNSFDQMVKGKMSELLETHVVLADLKNDLKDKVSSNQINPYQAAQLLTDKFVALLKE